MLEDYAITDRQRAVIRLKDSKTKNQIAEELGLTYGQVRRAIRTVTNRASLAGYSPEHDMTRPVPETHLCKGVSSYYNEDGKLTGQWVKSTVNQKRLEDFARILSESVVETIKPIKPRKASRNQKDPDLLVWYPISDAHIGLYCWEAEAEGNWDCKMAEEVLLESLDHVLHNSPSSSKAVIANLGDWFHTDTPKNMTNASGHQLDVDSRWAKIVMIGRDIMIRMIDSALLKHDTVHVINERGNHDENSSFMFTAAIQAWYRDEPRVTVDMSPDVFHWYEFGKCFFATHHGHIVNKPEVLYRVMCEDKREEYGRCLHHYFFTGHIHHHTSVDVGSMRLESFNTVIPRDSYAHSHGYRANRGQQAITYHKERGECSRVQYLIQSR